MRLIRFRRLRSRIPLDPGNLPPATAPIDQHAKDGLEAFDTLPEDIRAFMKTSRRSYKSLEVQNMLNRLCCEDLTLYRLKKLDRQNHNPG